MEKPIIADSKPMAVTVKKGETYYWCSCGKSSSQPYCDGSHVGTDFNPLPFIAEKDGTESLCLCKHTNNPPYCDGSHRDAEESVSQPSKKQEEAPKFTGATKEEPTLKMVKDLAEFGISGHGEMGSMGVPRPNLPQWEDIQILPAQLTTKPLMEDVPVATTVTIGKNAQKPLTLNIPIFVSDISFGSLSQEAKMALATGAEMAGTGICSGEGGMLKEEQQLNKKYFYELASAQFGFEWDLLKDVQAFHFKVGQAAKTGTGGHLPGNKVTKKIAEVRKLQEGQDAISPPTFTDLATVEDFKNFANRVREVSGGIPIGFKMSANHIEADIQFAVDATADYIILDGRGGGTGAAPLIFRDNISIPTVAAIGRAKRYLKKINREDITLIITGGLRVPADVIKALALGADAIAISTSAMQSIGCIGARICNTNMCPAGIATQNEDLRSRLHVGSSAKKLYNFFSASIHLMQIMSRACGHASLNNFSITDLSTDKKEISELSGINFSGNSVN